MERRTRIIIAAAALATVVVGGLAGAATADGDDDAEAPITGDALERATAVALAHTGGGLVTETEVGDEESYYEVEVSLDDGRQIDVQLDRDFGVVSSSTDTEDDG